MNCVRQLFPTPPNPTGWSAGQFTFLEIDCFFVLSFSNFARFFLRSTTWFIPYLNQYTRSTFSSESYQSLGVSQVLFHQPESWFRANWRSRWPRYYSPSCHLITSAAAAACNSNPLDNRQYRFSHDDLNEGDGCDFVGKIIMHIHIRFAKNASPRLWFFMPSVSLRQSARS